MSNLLERDYQDLANSFITPVIAEQAKLRRVNDIEGAEIVCRKRRAGTDFSGVVFPYFLPSNYDYPREYRLRRDTPDLEIKNDGSTKEIAKYLAAPGTHNMIYFPPCVRLDWLSDISMRVILTEGEKKTLSLYRLATADLTLNQWHFLPLGLSGVWNWRGTVEKRIDDFGETVEIKGLISDFLHLEWKSRKVSIVYDRNVKTNPSVNAARRRLAKELREKGAKVFLIDLPKE